MNAVAQFRESRGEYRRAILLRGVPGRVDAELEDNVHHFTATIWHDGAKVLRAEGGGIRTPFTTCSAGAAQMEVLAGSPLVSDLRDAYGLADVRFQCTHAFQLAAHALVHATRGEQVWLYEVRIEEEGDVLIAQVRLNQELLLDWRLSGDRVVAPEQLAGLPTAEAVKRVVEGGAELAEGAVILHRAVRQALAQRRVTHLSTQFAAGLSTAGNCYTFQPVRAGGAGALDMTRNFEREGVWPLQDKANELRAATAGA